MANEFFVMIPPGYAGKSTAEKELVDFVVQYSSTSQAWRDANAGKIIQGAEGDTGNPQISEQLVRWMGPYATQAAAKTAANPQQQSINPVNDATNAVENSTNDPLTSVTDFLARFTEKATWIRVVEVLLGLGLAIVALDKLLSNTAAGPAVHKVAKAALLA